MIFTDKKGRKIELKSGEYVTDEDGLNVVILLINDEVVDYMTMTSANYEEIVECENSLMKEYGIEHKNA